jgi:short subunit fatty acids transporter
MATTTADDTTEDATPRGDRGFVAALDRFYPGALPLAAVLGIGALLVTIPFLDPVTQLELFATGFFELFTVQMPLILFWVLSAAVVESVWGGRILDRVAGVLPSNSQATVVYATGFVALLFGWINWALGLVGGVLVGYRLCRHAENDGVRVHYPAVLTAGLLALVTMNQGPSSPGALLMADASGTTNFLVDPEQGRVVLDMAAFLLHPANLAASALFVVTLPALLVVLAPSEEGERRPVSSSRPVLDGSIAETLDHYAPPPREEWAVADRLEQSPIISVVTFLLGAASVVAYFATGGRLTMLWLLFTLMTLGVLIQGRPMAFVEKTRDATKWVNHVAIPFLLYAGVYALLTRAELYAPIGNALAATGVTQASSYVVAFVLGLLVPDPGSVWVIQGPALVAADADLVSSVVSVMYGAGVSNLWLGFLFVGIVAPIAGFDWREYARYAAAITAYVSVVVIALLVVF